MLQCNVVSLFSRVIQQYTTFANFTGLYFPHFTIFYNQTSQRYQINGALSNCSDKFSQFKNLGNNSVFSVREIKF